MRIYNPVTGKYYPVRKRKKVKRGTIKGLWDYKKKKRSTGRDAE